MCKRTMYKRARIPMFLWERCACANSGAHCPGRFSSPPQKRPGNEAMVERVVSMVPGISQSQRASLMPPFPGIHKQLVYANTRHADAFSAMPRASL